MKMTVRPALTVLLATLFLVACAVPVARAQRVRTPAMLTAELAERVVGLELQAGFEASLLMRLRAAEQAFERGDVTVGVQNLRSFQSNVWAHGRGANAVLFVYDANELSALAQIVVDVALNSGLLLGGNNLQYIGGTILAHPKVFITFWGSDWKDLSIDFASANVYGFLPGFLEQIGGTPYMETLTQYYQENPDGSKTFVSNDSNLVKGVWVDSQPYPTAAQLYLANAGGSLTTRYDLTDDQIHAEVLRAVDHFGYDADAVYIIATDVQRYWVSSQKKASAYHSSFQSPPLPLSPAYAELPYQGIWTLHSSCTIPSRSPSATGRCRTRPLSRSSRSMNWPKRCRSRAVSGPTALEQRRLRMRGDDTLAAVRRLDGHLCVDDLSMTNH